MPIQYVQDDSKEDGGAQSKAKGNRYKLDHRSFHLNLRKNFFTLRVQKHWKRLSRKVV